MSSKREEERNEKIIRGLMKLPPNRRCINCNSLGPQYVCTSFWTFVCITCSGIHREFTHRVKSVSMAKFTSQEVDALQKGGNQRARELFLNAWDPQSQRLPNNSNIEKVREFIKNVYVQKKYAMEKLSDRPPKDPQDVRNPKVETERASSYHSFSQSPPYDFQYEERRYGKPEPALSRKPGSDRGLYGGTLSSFLSPSRLVDHTSDDRFANESSYPRVSDYSFSSSQKDTESPIVEPSRGISREVPLNHAVVHDSNASVRNTGGGKLHPQSSSSSGSFGSFDSNSLSFKSVNSSGLPDDSLQSKRSVEISGDNNPSSLSGNFNAVDLFSASFMPPNVISATPTIYDSQMQDLSSSQSTDLFLPISSSTLILNEQKPLQTPQLSTTILSQQQSAALFDEDIFDAVKPNNEGWATFDILQNVLPSTGYSASAALPPSSGNPRESLNPVSLVQSSSHGFVSQEPSVAESVYWKECQKNDGGTSNTTHLWNAFEEPTRPTTIHNMPKSSDLSSGFCTPYIDNCIVSDVYEVLNGNGIGTSCGNEPPSSILSSQYNMALNDFSVVPAAAGVGTIPTDQKPTNPFDLSYDPEIESGSLFWDMSSLQAALPDDQMSTSFVVNANQSWFSENTGPLGFMAAQIPCTQIPNIATQGPVASIGGNPFA